MNKKVYTVVFWTIAVELIILIGSGFTQIGWIIAKGYFLGVIFTLVAEHILSDNL